MWMDHAQAGMKVPMREIEQSETNGIPNPPVRVYDTSGPYTDPAYKVELEKEFQRRVILGSWSAGM